MNPFSRLSTLLLLALACAGCGTLKMPRYKGGPSAHAITREAEGLKITVDPFTDKARAGKYFKASPAERKVTILHLRAQNQSADAAWLLATPHFVLRDAPTGLALNAEGQTVKGDFGAANAVGFAGGALVSFPLLIAAMKMAADAMVVEKTYVDNLWRNRTLSPGQSAAGFVYFVHPSKTNFAREASLRLECLDVRSQKAVNLEFPIAYERK
jgi:hypothetical protein